MIIENQKVRYNHIQGVPVKRIKNLSEESFEEFLDENPMTVFYADDSISYGTNYLAPKQKADEIPEELIETLEWENVNLSKESQGSEPYETDSIQYYIHRRILQKYDFLIDDDGSGEVADLVAINNSEHEIDITLYHLKYAIKGKHSKSIENLYQVCGQAQKSIRWKYQRGNKIFEHILKRSENKEASNKKELRFHVVIVQPGMRKSDCTHEMKLLLGCTVQFLKQMANIDCRVICSK